MDSPPPTLHRALLLSLPGAALLSLPVGVWAHATYLRQLGLQWLNSSNYDDLLIYALWPLAPVTMVASSVAILEAAKSESRPLLRVGVMLFNLLAVTAAVIAGFALIAMAFGAIE